MPANELNFDTTIPATRVGKLYNYIQIPEFSYTGIIWKGVSEIVVQFNYSLTNNFILRRYPVKPVGVNFNICIKYRVGMTVFRYKLWEGLDEVMPNIPKYTGQLIKKNCVVEIWTVGGLETVSLDAVINLETSILTLPASLTDLSDVENTDPSAAVVQQIAYTAPTVPTTALWGHYKADSGVTAGSLVELWSNSDSQNPLHNFSAIGALRPQHVVNGGGINSYIEFTNQGQVLINSQNPDIHSYYLVAKVFYNVVGGSILRFDSGDVDGTTRNYDGTRINIKEASLDNLLTPGAGFIIIYRRFGEDEIVYVGLSTFDGASSAEIATSGGPTTSTLFTIGDPNEIDTIDMQVKELLVYDAITTNQQHQQILAYLANRYNFIDYRFHSLVLPQLSAQDVAWLDNN